MLISNQSLTVSTSLSCSRKWSSAIRNPWVQSNVRMGNGLAPLQNSAEIHRRQGKTLGGGERWVQIGQFYPSGNNYPPERHTMRIKMKGIHFEDWLLLSWPYTQQIRINHLVLHKSWFFNQKVSVGVGGEGAPAFGKLTPCPAAALPALFLSEQRHPPR